MKKLEKDLVRSIEIANTYHANQTCRGKLPYILHPLRVMSRIEGRSIESNKLRIVAVLHDILEDTNIDMNSLSFLDDDIYKAIETITRKPSETYQDYLAKVKEDPLARQVKLIDLDDNLDMSRLLKVTEKDIHRCEKYCNAIRFLEE
jgi:(p)ppGpp synthase/HD superfamily hydrolase